MAACSWRSWPMDGWCSSRSPEAPGADAVRHRDAPSRRHRAAGRFAHPARVRARLTVVHLVRSALLRAQLATVGAEGAESLSERAVTRHRVGAQATERRAVDAAGWTRVGALLPRHVGRALAARDGAVVAGGHAGKFGGGAMIGHWGFRREGSRRRLRRDDSRVECSPLQLSRFVAPPPSPVRVSPAGGDCARVPRRPAGSPLPSPR